MEDLLRICVMGASTDTGNLGVSALCLSILGGLARRAPDAAVTVFDNRRGHGVEAETFDGRTFRFKRSGLHDSRRFYRGDSLWNVALASRLGGAGNPAAESIREADAVLDVTGGDSFTDLYGGRRFWSGCAAKRLALRYSGGLVLMPQTYGPYADVGTREEAATIVGAAKAAWARDARSFEVLSGLLGARFDASRHRLGVDVAFSLVAADPRDTLPAELARRLDDARPSPTVGVNVSGLTYLRHERARRAYGLAADYRAVIHALLERFLEKTDARVVLVPHVLVPRGHFESDREACEAARAALGSRAKGRVLVAPDLSASEAKGLIAHLDWFCGTRMHSTIAALSSGVPAAALAYSAKTTGVFETCGQGAHVADLRTCGTQDAVETAWRSWESRDDARRSLAAALPTTLAAAERQMDEIVATCRDAAARRRGALRVAM